MSSPCCLTSKTSTGPGRAGSRSTSGSAASPWPGLTSRRCRCCAGCNGSKSAGLSRPRRPHLRQCLSPGPVTAALCAARGALGHDVAIACLHDVVFDSRHPALIARFWPAVLDGYQAAPYDEAELARLRGEGIFDPEDDP